MGMSDVGGEKGICYQWKEKDQCSKGDQCSFRHESNDRAQKLDHNAATPSEPSMTRSRSVSKKTSIQDKSKPGANLRQPCRLGLFQDSDFAGDLEDSKSTSGGILCIFASHTFVP